MLTMFGVALTGFVWLGACEGKQSDDQKIITIGATLPPTGDAAVWGKNTQKGIELALAEINAAGGVLGRKLQVVYEDTQALAREGVSAYRKLVATRRLPVIIDDSVSSVTLAMAPLAQKDNVVVLATAATAPAIMDARALIFRIWNSDAYEGEFATRYAYHDLKHRTASILLINNDYGKGLERVFESEKKR